MALLIMGGDIPAPSHHSSTICEVSDDGRLMAAWFAGEQEGASDVAIWAATFTPAVGWGELRELVPSRGKPNWNPVLFRLQNGQVLLFYKEGRSTKSWTAFLKRSDVSVLCFATAQNLPPYLASPLAASAVGLSDRCLSTATPQDNGATWGPAEALPAGIIGPTKVCGKRG
jgi:predicted neuraminidase